jgi:hypothetical protein
MTDIKTEIKSFAAKEETAAKAWFGTNWVPYALGLISGVLLMLLLHKL